MLIVQTIYNVKCLSYRFGKSQVSSYSDLFPWGGHAVVQTSWCSPRLNWLHHITGHVVSHCLIVYQSSCLGWVFVVSDVHVDCLFKKNTMLIFLHACHSLCHGNPVHCLWSCQRVVMWPSFPNGRVKRFDDHYLNLCSCLLHVRPLPIFIMQGSGLHICGDVVWKAPLPRHQGSLWPAQQDMECEWESRNLVLWLLLRKGVHLSWSSHCLFPDFRHAQWEHLVWCVFFSRIQTM